MLVQTDAPNLIRDTSSRAIFPKREALDEFRRAKKKDERVSALETRVDSIEQKLDKILELLLGGNK